MARHNKPAGEEHAVPPPEAELGTPTVETQPPEADPVTPTVETQPPEADPVTPPVETQPPEADPVTPPVEAAPADQTSPREESAKPGLYHFLFDVTLAGSPVAQETVDGIGNTLEEALNDAEATLARRRAESKVVMRTKYRDVYTRDDV